MLYLGAVRCSAPIVFRSIQLRVSFGGYAIVEQRKTRHQPPQSLRLAQWIEEKKRKALNWMSQENSVVKLIITMAMRYQFYSIYSNETEKEEIWAFEKWWSIQFDVENKYYFSIKLI